MSQAEVRFPIERFIKTVGGQFSRQLGIELVNKGWCQHKRCANCPMRNYCSYYQDWSDADDQMR